MARPALTTLLAGVVIAASAVAGCSSSSASPSAAGIPSIIGTWTGTGRAPNADGTIGTSTESFVVTKQDGPLVWGTFDYQAADGSPIRDTVAGTFLDDGRTLVLTEPSSLIQGEVTGATTMKLVISWEGGAGNHGAFQVVLTKQ